MKLAYCGLDCSKCEAYIATKSNDDNKREIVAANWSKMYGVEINPNEINCHGCHSDVLFSHCRVCKIRKCGLENKISTCGSCPEYSCEKLKEIHDYDESAKKRLDDIANDIKIV